MEGFQSRLLKEIENAGKHIYKYWQISLKYDVDFRTDDVRDFLKNSMKAVKWFCGQTFFAGRQDWLSDIYRRAFFAAFDQTFNGTIDASKISDKTGLLVERFEKNVNDIRKKGGESYKTRKKDEDAFKNALKFVGEELDAYAFNPVCYLKDKIERHELRDFFEKTEIPQVGPKLKSLIARDITVWYDLQPDKQELQFIFPVDAWVRKLCELMWPETIKMSNPQLANYMTGELERLGISPMYFDAGLWALGWYGRGAIELLLEKRTGSIYESKPEPKQQKLTFTPMEISRSLQAKTTSEKKQLELSGKNAVLEQLKSMGYNGSLTSDYHPKILACNPRNGKQATIWVKTTKDKTLFPIGKMTREQMHRKFTVPAVFVKIDAKGEKKFYVLAAKDIPYLIEKGYDWWIKEVKHRKKNLAPFEEQSQGILIRFIREYENQWKNLGLE
jgi:hypothetical protein